ncbi:MAG: hypothetical protein IT371_11570 [Deltaproteobacteria bacterium]|nr:hypothetical protein [Deltaproteobacteria bacterium]
MAYYCWKCRNELEFAVKVGVKVGRLDTCPHCAADLHACKNCRFYDPGMHNECRENQAEFIRDREAGNFCAHYEIVQRLAPPPVDDTIGRAKSKLDDLFKGLK